MEFMGIKQAVKLLWLKRRWREKNPNNSTTAGSLFIPENVEVGEYTYGTLNIRQYHKDAKLKIGRYCSIANGVEFLLGGNHSTKDISTYPFGSRIYKMTRGGILEI